MRKFLLWGFVLIISLAAFVVIGASLTGTTERPLPDTIAAYHVTELSTPHRETPLPVHIWYPTTADGPPELFAQNALFYGFHAYRDGAPVAGPLPMVVVSHGSGGNAPGLGWLASDLAARGMIVVATNHPGTTSRDSDPFQNVRVWERPQDMTALIDYMIAAQPNGIVPDENRIGVLGFSLGGHSALSLSGIEVSKDRFIAYCDENAGLIDCGWMQEAGVDFTTIDAALYEQSNKDDRVIATVAIDPALPQAVKQNGTAALDTAPLIINLGPLAEVPVAMRADQLAAATSGARFETISGAYHFSFLAECSRLGKIIIALAGDDNICDDTGMRDRGEVHVELQEMIGAFLEDRLGSAADAQ